MLTVLCIEDHPLAQAGLIEILSREADLILIGKTGSAEEGIRLFRKLRPDIVLMDFQLPDWSGIKAMNAIHQIDARARVIILTAYDDPGWRDSAFREGASAFLLKDKAPTELAAVIRRACC